MFLSALRDNRIELVRASWHELSISITDVMLSDEGQYTCSLFTMPVKTSKAFLTVLGEYYKLTKEMWFSLEELCQTGMFFLKTLILH